VSEQPPYLGPEDRGEVLGQSGHFKGLYLRYFESSLSLTGAKHHHTASVTARMENMVYYEGLELLGGSFGMDVCNTDPLSGKEYGI